MRNVPAVAGTVFLVLFKGMHLYFFFPEKICMFAR